MDKKILKEFSASARNELINQITLNANNFGVYEDKNSEVIIGTDYVIINGNKYKPSYAEAYRKLIRAKDNKGFGILMEQVAYTWFNRFIALRFMEVNDYLPSHIRILSSEINGKVYPDILEHYDESGLSLDFDEIDNYIKLNKNEEAYRKLLIAQCNELSEMLPFLFEKINDYTDMLLPDNLLTPESIISKLVNNIAQEDFYEVETIGWIYQYYISEKKDEVINAKKKYKKEEIPFATQLFTPDWIVRYMVQNSLGRYWVESHPEQNGLKNEWEFYLENSNPEPNFEEKLKPYINKELRVENLKVFDPACGSGHILVYIFEVLYEIYSKCGYMERDIPKKIIENNLFGLDIDDRAYQLACFSVIMKGMKYNDRLLRDIQKDGIKLNIVSIQETNMDESDISYTNYIAYIAGEKSGQDYEKTKKFIETYNNAKIYGSLIDIKEFDKKFFDGRLNEILENPKGNLLEEETRNRVLDHLPNLIKQAEIMVSMYDVLVTNPPYMGSKYMNAELSEFIRVNYKDYKSDMFSAFMEYSLSKVKYNGQLGFMTPFVWMFISSYEKLREVIIDTKNISSLIQLEYSGFQDATVPICTFTLRNYWIDISGEYIKLSDFKGSQNQPIKTLEAVKQPNIKYRYSTYMNDFHKIPGKPIAYWVSNKVYNIFQQTKELREFAEPRHGMSTGNNAVCLKKWYEVSNKNIAFSCQCIVDFEKTRHKWVPYNKGGAFRKWYGNNEYIIAYDMTSRKYMQSLSGFRASSLGYFFKPSINWSDVSSTYFGVRYSYCGFAFDGRGASMFSEEKITFWILGFLCSKITREFLKILNPTLTFNIDNIASLPLEVKTQKKSRVDFIVEQNIAMSKVDWDSFETSWEFMIHPLYKFKIVNAKGGIQNAFEMWKDFTERQFYKLKDNEEEINRIFIEIYGLQDEMTPEVEEKDVTIKQADRERDIESFISYAVGCMFGRYSLDEEGLIYAGGEFYPLRYKTFKPDSVGIIPILSQSYFEDDITNRFVEFVKVAYGEKTLNENLDYISETLGKKNSESSRDAIRRYFIDGFYADHCKVYKGRPIYWLVDSGKKKGFRALIYIHRYNTETLATLRLNYLLELQAKYSNEENQINKYLENEDLSTLDVKNYNKKLLTLSQIQTELLAFDKVLDEMANKKINLDLDDGVVENYKKLQGILAKIK